MSDRSHRSKATPGDRVRLCTNNGIWFDTVTTLAQQRCTNPNNAALTSSWAALLKSVQLDATNN